MIIAIDGPAGSGKSSTAKALAKSLGFLHINSGAMYRAIAFALHAKGKEYSDEAVIEINEELKFVRSDFDLLVEWSGRDISVAIRGEDTGILASKISQVVLVRELVGEHQRILAQSCLDEGSGVVVDGRDIGTIVFPDAQVKLFLDADPEVRARRRVRQLSDAGEEVDFNLVLKDLIQRDYEDRNREIAPLAKASDAVLIDSTDLNFEEQLEVIETIIEIRSLSNPDESSKMSITWNFKNEF